MIFCFLVLKKLNTFCVLILVIAERIINTLLILVMAERKIVVKTNIVRHFWVFLKWYFLSELILFWVFKVCVFTSIYIAIYLWKRIQKSFSIGNKSQITKHLWLFKKIWCPFVFIILFEIGLCDSRHFLT